MQSAGPTFVTPICSYIASPEQLTPLKSICGSNGSSLVGVNLKCIFDPASLYFHLPSTSNKLLPSERFATSVAMGYHATYPAPRTPVKFAAIWSQSVLAAVSSG